MRIRKTRWKVAFVVGLVLTNVVLNFLVSRLIGSQATHVASTIASIAFLTFGVRNFRGAGELVSPARAWWRFTAKPTAGFVISALLVLSALSTVSRFALGYESSVDAPFDLGSLFLVVVIAALYGNSSFHQVSLDRNNAKTE